MLLAADSELRILENLNAIKGMFEYIDIYPPIDNFFGNLPYLTIFLSVFLGVVIQVMYMAAHQVLEVYLTDLILVYLRK